MMLQEVEIFRAPFLPAGTKMEFSRETSRVKLYLDDLSRVVPRLAKLRACEMVVVIDRDQGTKEFVVLLREVKHFDLFSSTSSAVSSSGVAPRGRVPASGRIVICWPSGVRSCRTKISGEAPTIWKSPIS